MKKKRNKKAVLLLAAGILAVVLVLVLCLCLTCRKGQQGAEPTPVPTAEENSGQEWEISDEANTIPAAGDIIKLNGATYSYEQLRSDLDSLAAKYRLTVISLGDSAFGHAIPAVRLGSENAAKKILVVGGVAGNESGVSGVIMKQLETYCASMGKTYRGMVYSDITAQCAIWFVPMLNPDGVSINLKGTEAVPAAQKDAVQAIFDRSVKNDLLDKGTGFALWQANGQGVDLNMNWGNGTVSASSVFAAPMSKGYPGEAPFSSPEAAALKSFCEGFSSVTVYTGNGEMIDWSFGQEGTLKTVSGRYASDLAALTGYTKIENGPTPEKCLSVGIMNWVISEKKVPAFQLMPSVPATGMGQSEQDAMWKACSLQPLFLAWEECDKPTPAPTKTVTAAPGKTATPIPAASATAGTTAVPTPTFDIGVTPEMEFGEID